MEFQNYEEKLDYIKVNEEVINALWKQYSRHVVLYSGEHILLNEYAKTVDLFMSEISKLNHNIEVLTSNRITKEKMESAIKSYEYIKEKMDMPYGEGSCEVSVLTYETFIMYTDCIKTMMENSGHYKWNIFSTNDYLVESIGD